MLSFNLELCLYDVCMWQLTLVTHFCPLPVDIDLKFGYIYIPGAIQKLKIDFLKFAPQRDDGGGGTKCTIKKISIYHKPKK